MSAKQGTRDTIGLERFDKVDPLWQNHLTWGEPECEASGDKVTRRADARAHGGRETVRGARGKADLSLQADGKSGNPLGFRPAL